MSQFFSTLTLKSGGLLAIQGGDKLVTLARNQLRIGEIAGIEERVNGEVRVRATVEAYDPNKKDGVMHVNLSDLHHLDSPFEPFGKRFVMMSEGDEAISRLAVALKERGEYAPGPDDPGGVRDPFLPPGKTGEDVINEAPAHPPRGNEPVQAIDPKGDIDGDGIKNKKDPDIDGDGVLNEADSAPGDAARS